MTNLSKELCKICDIDSKTKCRPYECDQVGTVVRDKCPADFSPNEKCLQHKDNTTAYYSYPDFKQAENFVKLQKLLIEIGMGFDIQLFDYPTKLQIRFCWDDENFTFKIFGDSLEEVFLRFAIQICELDDEGDIKLAIREAEWGYE